jgi:sterol desaturase/sphingolipid hydroxylase (fatty acid hydroxylase superfamily)
MASEVLSRLLASMLAFVERSTERTIEMAGWLVDGGHRFFWLYLLTSAVIAVGVYRRHYRGRAGVPGSVLAFLFPRAVYLHPSAILDYKLMVANRILGPAAVLSSVLLGSLSVSFVALATQSGLNTLTGRHAPPGDIDFFAGCALVVALTLVRDFSSYLNHALHHRWPLLWEFHKVHHSAEVMTPATVFRKHPVYNLFSDIVDALVVGPLQGLVLFSFGATPDPLLLFGGNAIFSTFHLLGSNLRHSHIWWSFGPALSRVLISPAQHQIHHSRAPQHWNRNFGEAFALWDWLFGTLYVPGRAPEPLEFGIAGAAGQEHPTLWAAYSVPFVNCARLLRGYAQRLSGRAPLTALGELERE